MKRYLKILGTLLLILSLISCGGNAQVNGSNNEVASESQTVAETSTQTSTQVSTETSSKIISKLVKCGQVYKGQDLSFNVLEVSIENNLLKLKMEVFNHSDEDVDYSPIDTLALYDENKQECSWNMMVGKLNGLITPQNKLVGVVGFDLEDENARHFVLHIGSSFDYEPAIEISDDAIGETFSEAFESIGVLSEFGIGTPVESDQFDMTVLGAKTISSDKDGKDILLIELAIKNNDTESRVLGLEIDGVYTADGQGLSTEVNEWTFTNLPIESGTTETGIVSYYCESGQTDFYMTVTPNIKDYTVSKNIVFSVSEVADTSSNKSGEMSGEGLSLLESLTVKRPETMKIVSEMNAFNSTTVMTTFYDGDISRTEIDIPGMNKSILLYIPDEEVMYQYVYGEEMGVKITSADPIAAADMGMMMDTQALAEITSASSEDLIAYVEDLDGEEVVYVEATQSDEDMGQVLVKMWYSAKYTTPLKYQVYVGETIMMSLKVTDIRDNVNFTADIFSPPEDVTFQEVDMEAMVENW